MLLDEQRFRDHGTGAAWIGQPGGGRQQTEKQDCQITHDRSSQDRYVIANVQEFNNSPRTGLGRTAQAYSEYYQRSRTHLALGSRARVEYPAANDSPAKNCDVRVL